MGVIAPIRTGGPVLTPHPELRGYQYLERFPFECGGESFVIPRGYVYDGATIPTLIGLLHVAMFSKYDPRVMDGAGRHDLLCDLEPWNVPSDIAAAMFGRIIVRDGISERKGAIATRAVNRFGPHWGAR